MATEVQLTYRHATEFEAGRVARLPLHKKGAPRAASGCNSCMPTTDIRVISDLILPMQDRLQDSRQISRMIAAKLVLARWIRKVLKRKQLAKQLNSMRSYRVNLYT